MVSRQIIRPGQTDEVPPHTHDATQITGKFNFLRALKGVITGDLTLSGFFRTAVSGPRIEIRPDSGVGDVPSIQWFDADGQTGFIEMEDQGSSVWALKGAGPNAGSGAAIFKLREDGIVVLDSDNSAGFIELFKYLKMNTPVRLADGTVSLPSLTFAATGQQDVGFYRVGDDIIGVTIAGSEVARFTANGLRGVEVASLRDTGMADFTNTSFADLDALTGTTTFGAVAVTVTTGTRAKVTITGALESDTTGAYTRLGYRVSGATTIAADDGRALFVQQGTAARELSISYVLIEDGLTPGSNTFELQARTNTGTSTLDDVELIVEPL